MPTPKYNCPHCGTEIKGDNLEFMEIGLDAGLDAYLCPYCGRPITKEEFKATYKKDEKQ